MLEIYLTCFENSPPDYYENLFYKTNLTSKQFLAWNILNKQITLNVYSTVSQRYVCGPSFTITVECDSKDSQISSIVKSIFFDVIYFWRLVGVRLSKAE